MKRETVKNQHVVGAVREPPEHWPLSDIRVLRDDVGAYCIRPEPHPRGFSSISSSVSCGDVRSLLHVPTDGRFTNRPYNIRSHISRFSYQHLFGEQRRLQKKACAAKCLIFFQGALVKGVQQTSAILLVFRKHRDQVLALPSGLFVAG